jgi:hypothetical protein
MAAGAQCAELAEGAADPEIAGDTVYRLMAHQLAAGHALTMSLGAHAGRLVREAQAVTANDDDGGRRSQEMLRFVAGTARLMERCRSAALALDRIGFPEVPEETPGGPEEGEPVRASTINGFPRQVIAARDRERRRLLHWLAQGKKLSELPEVSDWPEYHNPDLPDLEWLDERLSPSTPRSSANRAAGAHAAPGLKRGRLKNGNPVGDYMAAPRCGARTRSGASCRQPAMRNGRCRFHGGKSTGPRTAAGLRRSQSARLAHGFRTADIIDLRYAATRIGRDLRALTRMAHVEPIRRQNEIPPLPLRERGQGVRGLARGSASISQSLATAMLAPGNAVSPPIEYQVAKRLMPRSRAETPHPCPSPLEGEGFLSFPDSVRRSKEMGPGISAGHGVHRPDSALPPSTAGHRQQQKRRRRA